MSEQDVTSANKPKRAENGQLLPGNTANPAGRPKGSVSVVAAIRKKLEEIPEGKTKTYLEYLTEQVFKKAVVEGDTAMIKDIIDRVDGKPKQPLTGGDEDDSPMIIMQTIYGSNHSSPIRPAALPDSDTPSDSKSEIQ